MIANSIFAASMVWLAIAMYLISELSFLAPYRDFIFTQYTGPVLLFSAVLFLNIAAVAYTINRKIFLKDTGRKLAHIEKQLRTGSSISAELTDRLSD
jgi:hypothetical protein